MPEYFRKTDKIKQNSQKERHYNRFVSKTTGESESVSCSIVANSLQLHGVWPIRLLCPWNSPGKNTFNSPGDLSDPRIKPRFLTLQADFLPSEPPGKPKIHFTKY